MQKKQFDGSCPIHLSADGRYFLDGKEQPFYWLGDTAWPLFTQFSQQEAQDYLAERARQGFTVILGVLAYGGGTSLEAEMPFANPHGERPWLTSPEIPNSDYFSYVDQLIELACQLGLTLALLPVWGYYITDVGVFTAESAANYGRWLGQRYQATSNIIWVIGGDRTPEHHREIFAAMAAGLREGDGGRHLLSYHPHAWRSSGQFYYGKQLDFEMIQTWREWGMIHPAVLADVITSPQKPVVLAEGAYEAGDEYGIGSMITAHQVRCQAWWTVTAGGYFSYGHRQMWRLDPGWLTDINAPGAQDMGILREIITDLPWWNMFPDQSLIYSGESNGRTLNSALRANDGCCALIYLSSPCGIYVALNRLNCRYLQGCYINPHNGERRYAGLFSSGNSDRDAPYPPVVRIQSFATPDGWEDAVLLLKNADTAAYIDCYCPPGG